MIKRRRFSGVFFGWWTVIGAGIINLWASGFQLYGFSALFKPIASELGFSRAVTSVAASITRFEGGLEGPIAGWAVDKFGPKPIIFLAVLLTGSGLLLMYYVNSLWAFYLVWGVIVGTGTNLLMLPFDTAISNWFVKKRGLAIGTRWAFSGAVILPLVAWMIVDQGWRMTLLVGGIGTWVIGLPIVWFCVRQRRPEYYGLLPDGATVEERDSRQTIETGARYAAEVGEVEFSLRQAIRTPGYWLLIVALSSHGLTGPVITIHAIPFLTDIGFTPMQAAGIMTMMLYVGIPLRPVGGLLADRVKKDKMRFAFASAFTLQAAGFAIYLLYRTIPMIYVWYIVYGIGNGIAYGFQTPIWGRYFGRKAIGSIRGLASMFMTPVGIVAPVYAGWVYDTTGSYIMAFVAVTVLLSVSIILLVLARPPKPPARVTDIRQIL